MKRVGFVLSGLALAALAVGLAPSAAQTVRDFIRTAPEDVRFKSALESDRNRRCCSAIRRSLAFM